MAHALVDSMGHCAIEYNRGPKYVHVILRLNGAVECKKFSFHTMITDPHYHADSAQYVFDERWRRPGHGAQAQSNPDGARELADLHKMIDSFLTGTLPVTDRARRMLERLRIDSGATAVPAGPETSTNQSTEEGEATVSTKKVKVKKEGGKKRTGVCAKVHEIAAKMGETATRGDVIEACAKAGINKATASTQYQKWLHRKD